jgi:hypothetical protein
MIFGVFNRVMDLGNYVERRLAEIERAIRGGSKS